MRLKIWNKADGLTAEAKAETFEADSVEDAVFLFADKQHDASPFDEIVIYVRGLEGKREGKLYEVTLAAETEVTFEVGLPHEVK